MANVNILGVIGASDSDFAQIHTYGQAVIYDAQAQILGNHNDDMQLMQSLFVEADTEKYQEIYKLPGTGRFQRRGVKSRTGEVKAAGEWTVGYPLEDFGADIAVSDVDWAYMTVAEFNRDMTTILVQDTNTRRDEVLKALFNNTARVFVHQGSRWPNTTVQGLANGDAAVYMPVIGAEINSTRNHYMGVAADSTTITDANNPIPAIVNKLEANFGTPTGGSDIVIFVNDAQTIGIQNLAGFNEVPNRFVSYGDNVSLVEVGGIPITMGRVLGECDGALIVEWRWIPAGYMLAIHMGAPKPLKRRVDPAETGLTTGLQMVAADMQYPFNRYSWRNRFGYGVGNRLNGVVMDLTAAGGAGVYTCPAKWA